MCSAMDMNELLNRRFRRLEYVMRPFLSLGSVAVCHSQRGVGKTHFGLGLAYAAATANVFLMWQGDRPFRVLYIDSKTQGKVLQERLAKIMGSAQNKPDDGFLGIIAPDLCEGFMPDLTTRQGQARIANECSRAELIVLDCIPSYPTRSVRNESEGSPWPEVVEWVSTLKASGKAVLLILPSDKNGNPKGLPVGWSVPDVTICLMQPQDYKPSEGARFDVVFKTAGPDAQPFEACLDEDCTGKQTWTIKPLARSRPEQVKEMVSLGRTAQEIAAELGVDVATVYRELKKLGMSLKASTRGRGKGMTKTGR